VLTCHPANTLESEGNRLGAELITGEDFIMQEDRNKQVIREFTRIFKNEHNVDGVAHLFDAKNFTQHFRAPVSPGFEGLKEIGRMMNGAFPDVVVTEEDLISFGDRVVERSSAVATHKGSMMGEKPTHKRIAWTEIHIYRVRDGKIEEHWAEVSMMELLQQIGVLPQLAQTAG
jgi:predicted ester cyclase